MTQIKKSATSIPVLAVALPEVAPAIARVQEKPNLGAAFARSLTSFPCLTQIAMDESLARLARELAACHRLRSSDAVYAAVVLRFGTDGDPRPRTIAPPGECGDRARTRRVKQHA